MSFPEFQDATFDLDGFLHDLDRVAPAAEIKETVQQLTRRRYRNKGLALKACRRKLLRAETSADARAVLVATVSNLQAATVKNWAARLVPPRRSRGTDALVELIADAYTVRLQEEQPTAGGGALFHSKRFKVTFELLQPIRGGGMAEAWKARELGNGRPVFLKRVLLHGTDQKALAREARTYEALAHGHFEHVLDVIAFDHDDQHVVLVTEWADGGTLEAYCEERKALPLRQVVQVGSDVGAGVAALHAAEVVHRDLKPGNVLRHGNVWKLADFGIAKNLRHLQDTYTMRGAHTLGYAPPEQRWNWVEARPSADVFSFAKILVYLATENTDVDRVDDPRLWRLCKDCTHEQPEKRPPMTAVLARLRDLASPGGAAS